MSGTEHVNAEKAARYATATDFMEIYNQEMDSLYLLSILLTVDIEKAEECFVSALRECLHGRDVFLERAHSWARREVIKRAIQLVMPMPESIHSLPSIGSECRSAPAMKDMIGAMLGFGTFERFVFVISLLEGVADEECAALLSCTIRDIKLSRAHALKRLSNGDSSCDSSADALQIWQTLQAHRNGPTSA
jgi:hypothetical protein